MTREEVEKRIIDACVRQIDTSFYGSAYFTVVTDDFDEEADVITTVEIDGEFMEEYGAVSFSDVRVSSTDDEGNEIITEVSRLIDEIDFYGEIERQVSWYLCQAA